MTKFPTFIVILEHPVQICKFSAHGHLFLIMLKYYRLQAGAELCQPQVKLICQAQPELHLWLG